MGLLLLFSGGPMTVTGAAVLTAAGSSVADGNATVSGTVAFTGLGAVATDGSRVRFGTATLLRCRHGKRRRLRHCRPCRLSHWLSSLNADGGVTTTITPSHHGHGRLVWQYPEPDRPEAEARLYGPGTLQAAGTVRRQLTDAERQQELELMLLLMPLGRPAGRRKVGGR